jgi:hypothetical protein
MIAARRDAAEFDSYGFEAAEALHRWHIPNEHEARRGRRGMLEQASKLGFEGIVSQHLFMKVF